MFLSQSLTLHVPHYLSLFIIPLFSFLSPSLSRTSPPFALTLPPYFSLVLCMSNILPYSNSANMAAFYGVYHGPDGLKKIASRVHNMTAATGELKTIRAKDTESSEKSSTLTLLNLLKHENLIFSPFSSFCHHQPVL